MKQLKIIRSDKKNQFPQNSLFLSLFSDRFYFNHLFNLFYALRKCIFVLFYQGNKYHFVVGSWYPNHYMRSKLKKTKKEKNCDQNTKKTFLQSWASLTRLESLQANKHFFLNRQSQEIFAFSKSSFSFYIQAPSFTHLLVYRQPFHS